MEKLPTIVIGSTNSKKRDEIESIISDLHVKLLTLNDFDNVPVIDEDGKTFKENAAKKAVSFAKWCNKPVIADDSGLEVEALGNRPGVYSSRYAGEGATDEMRIEKLLTELCKVNDKNRIARFKCAIAFAVPQKLVFVVEAECNGIINKKPSGHNGFGYDPVFYVPEYGKTFAEITPDVKNKISHRAKALTLFRERFVKEALNSYQ